MHRLGYDQTALRCKTDLHLKPIKALGNIGLVRCLHGFQQPYHVSKECHFLAGTRTSRHFGDLENRGTHPKPIGTAGNV